MAKNVFRPTEVINLTSSVSIEPPPGQVEEQEEIAEVPQYTGPTADDLRREAEAFRESWEKEKAAMVDSAKSQAESIIKDAEQTAFDKVKAETDEAEKIRREAEDEAARIKSEAEEKARKDVEEAQQRVEQIEKDAYQAGLERGREEGYGTGKAEVERLVEQLHSIINAAIAKRNELIEESETLLIDLVLLIARKVIKVISENQKNVVINNVIQALRKLKSRGEVVIRTNLTDVQLTTDHVKDFMQMVENAQSITVVEDSSVDKGGCIIETDFGLIDARISSQLHEIEERITELTPIKVKGED